MTHVVTDRCVDCRYTDCCAVCPVECFYEVKSPAMLVIDPGTCIDCALCIPECPIYAIYPEEEVPDPYQEWIQKNADLFSQGENFTAQMEALPSAIALEEIHAREKAKGWDVNDPAAVADAGPAEGAAPVASAAAPPPPPPPPPGASTDGSATTASRAPRFESRPALQVRPGGRIRVGYRVGTVQEIRRAGADAFVDMQILFDTEDKPIWFLYSALQTMKDAGEVEIINPGPSPGIFELLFGEAKF